MMKRMLAMLLVVLMVLSLAGCGADASDEENSASENDIVSSDAENTAAEETWYATKKIGEKEYYILDGRSYPAELGAPVLKKDAGELKITEIDLVAEAITTAGDAILYLSEQPLFDQPRDVCEQFTQLISEDYDEVGLIHFEWPNNYYCIAYILQDDIYYTLDLFRLINSVSDGVSSFDAELEVLCKAAAENLSNGDEEAVPSFYTDAITEEASSQQHGATTYSYAGTTIPEGLGQPLLSDDEIDALIAKADYTATAQTITTLADAVNYIRRAGMVFDGISPIIHDPEPAYSDMQYVKSAWQVLKDNSGQCWTMSNLLHYFLKEDYEEVGYIHARTPGDGHVMAYIYHDDLYYIINSVGYCIDAWESDWFGSYPPELLACADDFQLIADSITQCMRLGDQELVNYVHLIKSPGDFAMGMSGNIEIYPVGTEVIRYYGPDFGYQETSYDWQSQTCCK